MKPVKKLSLFTVSLFLLLTNYTSVLTKPCFSFTAEPKIMPVGSVPPVADAVEFTYIPDYPIHFIGDSRTVGMKQALVYYRYDLTNHVFTARVGKGYSWLAGQKDLTTVPPSILVLNLGVNDLGNLKRYQALYEEYASGCWSSCPIYIVSVNPCCSPCTSVSNRQIEAFNTSMQEWIQEYNDKNTSETSAFPIRYIDTYSYLISEGYASADGLHYSAATYEAIYNYILEEIQEPLGDGSGTYVYSELDNP